MPRNFTLSRSGTEGSAASWSTRPLKASQLISLGIVLLFISDMIAPLLQSIERERFGKLINY
jgi:hypothetical protein